MQKSRRATNVWLVFMGIIFAAAMLSGQLAPQLSVILLGVYAALVLFATGAVGTAIERAGLTGRSNGQQDSTVTRRTRRRSKVEVSKAAQQAARRAGEMPTYISQFDLVDIGLIVNELGPDGLNLRRGNPTLDDQGVQPYVVLNADPSWHGETVNVRYRIVDQTGATRFVHEEDAYLQAGQNNLLSTHRLPLGRKAPDDAMPGHWELRIEVAGSVVGLHTFAVGPSVEQRRRIVQQDMEQRRGRLRDDVSPPPRSLDADDDSPVSLEDLLKG